MSDLVSFMSSIIVIAVGCSENTSHRGRRLCFGGHETLRRHDFGLAHAIRQVTLKEFYAIRVLCGCSIALGLAVLAGDAQINQV